ncbi:hypothetical protein MTR67_028784, partial [Solanum verrucosum]
EEVEVKEIIQNRQWDIARLSQLLSHNIVGCILKDISSNMSVGAQDKAWWMGNSQGEFIVRERANESQDFAWHTVASWTWDAQDETCGICRMAFDGCCPDCKLPGDDCPLIWGACNHAFHLHCILKWVNSQSGQAHCPMCRREWQFKE